MNSFIRYGSGQGNHISQTCNSVSTNGTSIVTRLVCWSLTGQGLNIQVYQHFGYTLHLVWWGNRNDITSERCMEIFLLMGDEIEKFCIELKTDALEGLCTSFSDEIYIEKVEICSRMIPLLSHVDWTMPRSLTFRNLTSYTYRTGVKLPSRCPILYLFNKYPYWIF